MCKCLNCGIPVKQIEGRRKRRYCSDKCRAAYYQKNKPKEQRYVLKKTYDALLDEIKNITSRNVFTLSKANSLPIKGEDVKAADESKSVNITFVKIPNDIQSQIDDYIEEIKNLGVSIMAKKRKKFCELKIEELKLMLKK